MRQFFNQVLTMLLGIMFFSACSAVEDDMISEDNLNYNGKHSTVISLEDAILDLNSLLSDLANASSRTGVPERVIKNAYTININRSCSSRAEGSDTIHIHIINFENDQGYAIMSGDERIPSLIAFSENGSLKDGDQIDNPGLIIFLQGMDSMCQQITEGESSSIDKPIGSLVPGGSGKSGYTEYGDWKNILYPPGGLCPVKWGQNEPYNLYCPEKNGEMTPTGCVVTAVAQLMAIYKYPSTYNGYTFDWNKMIDFYLVSSEAKENIARLMQQLGLKQNLAVSYGSSKINGKWQSSADSRNIMRTLKAFGYSNGGQIKDYNTYIVISELKQGYPILLSGYCYRTDHRLPIIGTHFFYSYSGGHQWLVHGLLERKREIRQYNANGQLMSTHYESQWYPQCNWGWNGYHDGYFLSEAFDASKQATFPDWEQPSGSADINSGNENNYQYKVEVVTGIRK